MGRALGILQTLVALPCLASVAHAQTVSAAHDDTEWQHDRQVPYPGAGWLESEGGSPGVEFPSSGIDLRSWISLTEFDPQTNAASDCWGYVAPSGREYAIIGLSLGTAFVEVTNPGDAQLIDVIAGATSDWRDIKTYQQYAYAVSEGGGGIQVFDLSAIDTGVVSLANTVTTGGRFATHNVAINAESGRLYRIGGGGSNPIQSLRIYSLADPTTPAPLGEWHDRYCHDAQVVTWTEAPYAGTEVAFCYANDTHLSGSPGIDILDVSDPMNVTVIASIDLSLPPIFSHAALYSHQGWLSPDRQYVYFNDEVDEGTIGNPTTTRIIDVSDLSKPTQVAIFSNGNTARDHNLYTFGDLIFEANYRSGLRVFSASDPLAPVEIAFFDTYPDDDNANYNGLWSVFPYFPSGTFIGSDIERGLFVWTFTAEPVPTLTVRNLLAMALLFALLATFAIRHRLRANRVLPATLALLAAVGLGCGSQEPSDQTTRAAGQTEPKRERSLPEVGRAVVEYSDGRVTLRANHALQLAILEQLAAQADFEISAAKIKPQTVTLQLDRVSLIEAIDTVLDGLAYSLDYELDESSGVRSLARIEITGTAAPGSARHAIPSLESESVRDAAARRDEDARADRSPDETETNGDENAEWIAQLDNPDPDARIDAIFWAEIDSETLGRMTSLLETDPDAEVRAAIVDRLGEEEESPAAVAALVGALRDPDSEVVLLAIEALEFVGEESLAAELKFLLGHHDPEVRQVAEDAIEFLE